MILEAKNIYKSFRNGEKKLPVLTDLNISVDKQETITIMGPSGSGKSTLLHIFSTFIKPDEGTVTLLGKDLYTLDDEAIEALRRYDIGIIFQFHYLFKGMSAIENIEVASMLSAEKIDDAILEKLEIKELMKQKIGELSGGQQQRVSVARVLSKKPRIIFADEPTGNLDKETAELVMDVLIDYIKETGAGLLLVTHDESMEARCDVAYKIEDKMLKEKI